MQLDERLFRGKLKSSIVYPEFFSLTSKDRVVNLGCGVGPQVVGYKGTFASMVCVDLSQNRLEQLHHFATLHGVTNIQTICEDVTRTTLPADSFDRAICIDIIEHLPSPELLLQEVYRLLKPGGQALITVPAMHDRWTSAARWMKKIFAGTTTVELPLGHLDRHNSDLALSKWLQLMRKGPLKLISTRATTLFPPLHLYGLPRFWFMIPEIHWIDSMLCRIPVLNRIGQAWMCILEKPTK